MLKSILESQKYKIEGKIESRTEGRKSNYNT